MMPEERKAAKLRKFVEAVAELAQINLYSLMQVHDGAMTLNDLIEHAREILKEESNEESK